MSRKWSLPILILFLCSSAALRATPLDSPGIVYIDGLPCNRACQSYMAWSNQALSARHRGERETGIVVAPAETEPAARQAARPRVAKHPVPMPRPAPRAGMAALNVKASNTGKAAASNSAYQPAGKRVPADTVAATGEKAGAGGQEPQRKLESTDRSALGQTPAIAAAQPAQAPKPEIKSEVKPDAKAEEVKPELALPPPATLDVAATSEIAALPVPVAAAPALAPRTIQQQVMEATAMADRVTASTLAREASNKSDNLVALVLARPEINSLSDLNNKNIAIEEKQSAVSGSVSAALMAAGAAEVQFSEVKAGAIEQLIKGEVPAVVLTLATREAADWFPDIKGFRTFRVPLSR